MIGAKPEAIEKGEARDVFKQAMLKIGLDVARSATVNNLADALKAADELIGDFPIIIRPSFTLGGSGGGIAYNREEYEKMVQAGLDASPTTEVLVEECLLGWKEYEMEVMRDHKDQCVVICSIENFDPMGVHTGDSITIAPAMTLTDKEYQLMRDASFACIREVGVETGGSNIQFSVNPDNGRMVVIEMNPRVSRSSALASKATGFPLPRSPPSSRWATASMNCKTTSPARPWPALSRPSTMSSPRSRVSPLRNSTARPHPDLCDEVRG